ncbi:carbon-nitrogen hydrolase family protein [Miltoncostaea marina]|uniref:carbon-nitrogen hydrolase family protein n=1 Tax=Miltoncostaea marina TaxID=2843215 RepID=UPI001C3D3044|nr:carbon-nitrogen hydrolase family protein [Miltoncostaea marina]
MAVAQATSVVMDGPASVEKACGIIREAGRAGARIVALPEGFVPLMPRPCWGHRYGETMNPDAAELHRRLWDNAVDVDGPLAARLAAAARDAGAWVAIGVNERDRRRPGTLWNTLLWLSPEGRVAGRHRKLVPTMHERAFWGQGAGDDLDAIEAGVARLGGLICWENFIPQARRRLHLAGVDVIVAPTADDRDVWVAAMRGFAFEAGAFVLSPVQHLRRDHFPADFPLREALDGCPETLMSGGSVIVDPWGEVLAGPVRGREEVLYADLEMDRVMAARRVLDTAGHYDRPGL